MPESLLEIMAGNLHKQSHLRQQEQRLQKGNTLQNYIRRNFFRKKVQVQDKQGTQLARHSQLSKNYIKDKRLTKIGSQDNVSFLLERLNSQTKVIRKDMPYLRWKSPLLHKINQASQQGRIMPYKANKSQHAVKHIYINQNFIGFGDFLKSKISSKEKNLFKKQLMKRAHSLVVLKKSSQLAHHNIINEFNFLLKHAKDRHASRLLLAGKFYQGASSHHGHKEIHLNYQFFVEDQSGLINSFITTNSFYQTNIRQDCIQLVSRFFNGLTRHKKFDLDAFMLFNCIFVHRNASQVQKNEFILYFLLDPKHLMIEICTLKLVFQMLASHIHMIAQTKEERQTKAKFVEQMLMKIMIGSLSQDQEKEFSIVDKDVLWNILERNSEAVQLLITLFHKNPIN